MTDSLFNTPDVAYIPAMVWRSPHAPVSHVFLEAVIRPDQFTLTNSPDFTRFLLEPAAATTVTATPRTDAEAGYVQDANEEYPQGFDKDPDGPYAKADYARRLELELVAAKVEIARLKRRVAMQKAALAND